MIPEYFALVGVLIASLGGFYYLYCTLRGTVQPHKVTFFFWGLFPLIIFFAQWNQDVGPIIWISFISSLLPFLILFASFLNPAAYWKVQKRDYLYALIAVFAMVLWYVTDEPNVALTLALIADFLVATPTISKAYTNPESESWHAYAINATGFTIALLSIQSWVFEEYIFTVYLLMISLTIAILAARKPRLEIE